MKTSTSLFSYRLMLTSASFNGILGIIFSFFPQEVLALFEQIPSRFATLAFQILGASFIGFAMMNYTAKKAVLGGIYNRPLQMGNTIYFMIAAITLIKYTTVQSAAVAPALWLVSLTYILLAAGFIKLLFSSPVKEVDA